MRWLAGVPYLVMVTAAWVGGGLRAGLTLLLCVLFLMICIRPVVAADLITGWANRLYPRDGSGGPERLLPAVMRAGRRLGRGLVALRARYGAEHRGTALDRNEAADDDLGPVLLVDESPGHGVLPAAEVLSSGNAGGRASIERP
jgi:hypothetical protein